MNTGSIGVFDSGVGGLSVLLEIRRQLPSEDLLYAADSGHAPYGEEPAEFIERRASSIIDFLIQQGTKAVVVACNTVTTVAVDTLRARWSIPVVAIEPAIKPAAAATKTGVVGVLATSQTIASARFGKLADTFGGGVEIVAQSCAGLVEQVEKGDLAGPETRALVEEYVRPLVERGADTLVLGCTHYPFLSAVIQDVAGPGVAIVNPAAAVARELRRRLEVMDLLAPTGHLGEMRFWTSGSTEQLRVLIARIGMEPAAVDALPV